MEKVKAIVAKISAMLAPELPDGDRLNVETACEGILNSHIANPTENTVGAAKVALHESISLRVSGGIADHVCNSIHNDLVELFAGLAVVVEETPASETTEDQVVLEPEVKGPSPEQETPAPTPVTEPVPSADVNEEKISSDEKKTDLSSAASAKEEKKSGGTSGKEKEKPLKEKAFSEVPEKDTFFITDDGAIAKFQKVSKSEAKCINSKLEGYDKGEKYKIAAKKKVSH